jgi:hypothetical protein
MGKKAARAVCLGAGRSCGGMQGEAEIRPCRNNGLSCELRNQELERNFLQAVRRTAWPDRRNGPDRGAGIERKEFPAAYSRTACSRHRNSWL